MESNIPSHLKWVKQLAAIGPYLRENRSREGEYFFDCLAVCLSARKAPEQREFYGWWFELKQQQDGMVYHYQFGVFDSNSQWLQHDIPAKHKPEVERTLQEFFEKLLPLVNSELGLGLAPADELDEKFHLSAA